MDKFLKKFNKRKYQRTNRLINPLFFYETCKFCGEEVSPCEPLYSICNCKGSIRWCHVKCVIESMKYDLHHPHICKICLAPYKVPTD